MIGIAAPTSESVMSEGPVMFHTMPMAWSMLTSRRGDSMAISAARRALPLPDKVQPQGVRV